VSQTVKVQEGVTVKVNARRVTVVGPRGKLTRDFKHLALDMQVNNDIFAQRYAGF
jgi:large subunit ribosomal protein L9e